MTLDSLFVLAVRFVDNVIIPAPTLIKEIANCYLPLFLGLIRNRNPGRKSGQVRTTTSFLSFFEPDLFQTASPPVCNMLMKGKKAL